MGTGLAPAEPAPVSVSVSGLVTRRPFNSAARTSARRVSIDRGSSRPRPRASRVNQLNAPAASVAVSIAHNVPIPSGSAVTTTRRSRRASRCRSSAPSGSAAMIALASAALSWANVCSGAFGSTAASTVAACSSDSTTVASSIARAFAVSISPDSHNACVSGSVASSRRASPIRAHAPPLDSRSATPTSSGAYSDPTHAQRAECGALSAGRRAASSSSSRACRAAAHEVSRSNPMIASTSDSSDNPAASAVARSRSSASSPDGSRDP